MLVSRGWGRRITSARLAWATWQRSVFKERSKEKKKKKGNPQCQGPKSTLSHLLESSFLLFIRSLIKTVFLSPGSGISLSFLSSCLTRVSQVRPENTLTCRDSVSSCVTPPHILAVRITQFHIFQHIIYIRHYSHPGKSSFFSSFWFGVGTQVHQVVVSK